MSKGFPKGKYFFGSVKVGERGQIVIPAKARSVFNINSGDQLLVFGDVKKGLGIIKASRLRNFATKMFKSFGLEEYEDEQENGGENVEE